MLNDIDPHQMNALIKTEALNEEQRRLNESNEFKQRPKVLNKKYNKS